MKRLSATALAELVREHTPRVTWTTDEWDELALRVWKRRARHPGESLKVALLAVQELQGNAEFDEWPEERRRKSVSSMKPLYQRLTAIDLALVEMQKHELPALKQTIESLRERPDKESILAAMSEVEIARRFSNVCLAEITPAEVIGRFSALEILSVVPIEDTFAFVGKSIFTAIHRLETSVAAHLTDHQRASATNGHTNQPLQHIEKAKPRIAVVGIQQHQLPMMLSRIGNLCEVIYVPKAHTEAIIADHCFLWETHVTGPQKQKVKSTFLHDKLTTHKGTFNQLVDRIEEKYKGKKPK